MEISREGKLVPSRLWGLPTKPLEAPLTIPGLNAWFDPRTDDYLAFSASNQTSLVVSRAGLLGPVSWQQVSATSQALRILKIAAANNKNGLLLDGVNDFFSASLGTFGKFMSDGSGGTIFFVGLVDSSGGATQTLLGSMQQNAAHVGTLYRARDTAGTNGHRIGNGSGSQYANAWNSIQGGTDSFQWRAFSYIDELATQAVSGVRLTNADIVAQEPSAANPTFTMTLGAATTGSQPTKGYILQALYYNRELTAADCAVLSEWAASEYGWPIKNGVDGFPANGSAYLTTTGGTAGTAAGFWYAAWCKVNSQTVGSATRYLVRPVSATSGGYIRCGGTNTNFSFLVYDNALSAIISPVYTMTSADVGRHTLVVAVHDGSFLRLYVNGVEIGAGTAITGYSVPTATQRFGDGLDGATIFGVAEGLGVPSLGEIQTLGSSIRASARMQGIPGKTAHLWNMEAPGTIADEQGSSNVTVVGSGLTSLRHTAAWGWAA